MLEQLEQGLILLRKPIEFRVWIFLAGRDDPSDVASFERALYQPHTETYDSRLSVSSVVDLSGFREIKVTCSRKKDRVK